MRHDDIWRALDALAAEHGLSASGLARKAGLDPTAFNPSKRIGADGRARWPSTESVAKVLNATGLGIEDFASLVSGLPALPRGGGRGGMGRRVPLIGLAQAGGGRSFDDGGYPVGGSWDEISCRHTSRTGPPSGRSGRGPGAACRRASAPRTSAAEFQLAVLVRRADERMSGCCQTSGMPDSIATDLCPASSTATPGRGALMTRGQHE